MTGGNVWRWESPPWHDEPVVRARLRIEYDDGRVQDVITDDAWRIADGPTVFDDLYAGETYDARARDRRLGRRRASTTALGGGERGRRARRACSSTSASSRSA